MSGGQNICSDILLWAYPAVNDATLPQHTSVKSVSAWMHPAIVLICESQ